METTIIKSKQFNVFAFGDAPSSQQDIERIFTIEGMHFDLFSDGQRGFTLLPELFSDISAISIIALEDDPSKDMRWEMKFWFSRTRQFKCPRSRCFFFLYNSDSDRAESFISDATRDRIPFSSCMKMSSSLSESEIQMLRETIVDVITHTDGLEFEPWEFDLWQQLSSPLSEFPQICEESNIRYKFVRSNQIKDFNSAERFLDKLAAHMRIIRNPSQNYIALRPKTVFSILQQLSKAPSFVPYDEIDGMISEPLSVEERENLRFLLITHCILRFYGPERAYFYANTLNLVTPVDCLPRYCPRDKNRLLELCVQCNSVEGIAHYFFQSFRAFMDFANRNFHYDPSTTRIQESGTGQKRVIFGQFKNRGIEITIYISVKEVKLYFYITERPLTRNAQIESCLSLLAAFSFNHLELQLILPNGSEISFRGLIYCNDEEYIYEIAKYREAERMLEDSCWVKVCGAQSIRPKWRETIQF